DRRRGAAVGVPAGQAAGAVVRMGVPGRGAVDPGRYRRGPAARDQRARGEVVRRAKPADAAGAAPGDRGGRDGAGGVRRGRDRPGRPDRQGLRHADLGVPGDLRAAADDLGRVAAVAAAAARCRRVPLTAAVISGAAGIQGARLSRFPAPLEMTVFREPIQETTMPASPRSTRFVAFAAALLLSTSVFAAPPPDLDARVEAAM